MVYQVAFSILFHGISFDFRSLPCLNFLKLHKTVKNGGQPWFPNIGKVYVNCRIFVKWAWFPIYSTGNILICI